MKPHNFRDDDLLISSSSTTISMGDCISCRLYSDTRPHCLETARLQKGLVLLIDGEEVIEEGVGFGTPVVIYEDRPYFSSSSHTSIQTEGDFEILTKAFKMDTISRKQVYKNFYLNDGFYVFFHRRFHDIYARKGKLTPILTKVIQLMKALNINTEFQQTKPRGIITVKYKCLPGTIEVEVHLSQLNQTGCKEVLMLNEQGASTFRKYSDVNGLILFDEQIGPWEEVNAEEASLSNVTETLAFSLKKMDGAMLLRGREKIQERYSWVGFSYSFRPRISPFKYIIRIEQLERSWRKRLGDKIPAQKINPHV
jgi:hypothetical protein